MRILIVEDDKNFGYVMKAELEASGFDADLTTDGVEGVLKFLDGGFEFILLDIKMPRLDGINALRIMKKISPGTPAITYSGNAGSGEMSESVKAGALRCITKPFALSQLTDEIRNYQKRRGEPAAGR